MEYDEIIEFRKLLSNAKAGDNFTLAMASKEYFEAKEIIKDFEKLIKELPKERIKKAIEYMELIIKEGNNDPCFDEMAKNDRITGLKALKKL